MHRTSPGHRTLEEFGDKEGSEEGYGHGVTDPVFRSSRKRNSGDDRGERRGLRRVI